MPRAAVPRYRTAGLRWKHPLGKVYSAFDGTTGQRVGLTLLHKAKGLTEAHLDACRATAGIIEGLEEPGVAGIRDVFNHPDGALALVNDYVEGVVLSTQVGSRALPVVRLIVILRQLCQILGRAHAAGVTHGALSVGSVILSGRAGRPDTVTVTDFGLQGIVAADLEIPDEHAALQPVSPERALGLTRGPREDIYLIGCLGYVMLTGGGLFRTGDAEAVMRRHAIEDPMPIGQRLKARRVPPKEIVEIIHRCLAKDPDDRFADLADLEAELCLAQIQTGIRTPWDAHLEVPAVDDARRDRIHRGLAPGSKAHVTPPTAAPTPVDSAESVPIDVATLDHIVASGPQAPAAGVPVATPVATTAPIATRKPLPLRHVEALREKGAGPVPGSRALVEQMTSGYRGVGAGSIDPATPLLPEDFPVAETSPESEEDESATQDRPPESSESSPSLEAGIPPPPVFAPTSSEAQGRRETPPLLADATAVPPRGRAPERARPAPEGRGADRPPSTAGEISNTPEPHRDAAQAEPAARSSIVTNRPAPASETTAPEPEPASAPEPEPESEPESASASESESESAAETVPSPETTSAPVSATAPPRPAYAPAPAPRPAAPTPASAPAAAPLMADEASPLEAGFRPILPTAAHKTVPADSPFAPGDSPFGSPAPAAPSSPFAAVAPAAPSSPFAAPAPAAPSSPAAVSATAASGSSFGSPAPTAATGAGFGDPFVYSGYDDDIQLPGRPWGTYFLLLIIGLAAGLGVAYAMGGLDPLLAGDKAAKPAPTKQAPPPEPVQVIKASEIEPVPEDFE